MPLIELCIQQKQKFLNSNQQNQLSDFDALITRYPFAIALNQMQIKNLLTKHKKNQAKLPISNGQL